jgi:hypothetical protein
MLRQPYAQPPSIAFTPPKALVLSPPKPLAPKLPQEECEHGGLIINGVARCGHCAGQGDSVEAFDVFLLSLYDICGRIAWKMYFHSIPYGDRKHQAFLSILDNLKIILGAKNPYAMAFTVAERSITDMTRNAVYWKEWPVSQLSVGSGAGIREARIEDFADLRMAVDIEGEPIQPGLQKFPGAHLLWKPLHLHRLERMLDDAMRQLPRKHVLIMKAHFGFFEECGSLTLEECTKLNGMTKDQVRYAIEQALESLRKSMGVVAENLIAEARS